jgi:hypothetical protein
VAGDFQAGSIVVALKAQVEDLKKGFAEAKATVKDFGMGIQETATTVTRGGQSIAMTFTQTGTAVQQGAVKAKEAAKTIGEGVQEAAKNVGAAGQSINNTFSKVEKDTGKFAARFGRFASRMLTLQFAFSGLVNAAEKGLGGYRKVLESASVGMNTFIGVISVLPTKTGFIVGALAALTTAVMRFLAPTQEAIDALRTMSEVALEVDRVLNTRERLFGRVKEAGGILGSDQADLSRERVDAARATLDALLRAREEAQAKRSNLKSQLSELEGAPGLLQDSNLIAATRSQIESLDRLLENIPEKIEEIRKGFGEWKTEAGVEQVRKDLQEMNAALQAAAKNGDMFLRLGLIQPLERLQLEAGLAEQHLNDLIAKQQELNRIKPGKGNELSTSISEAANKALEARRQAARGVEVDRMAQNFSGAIGQGIVDGILAGQSAMETLANVGRNLFENMVRDVVGSFQTLMNDAFKAITGVAGVELGSILTGIMGVAGMFLSQRGKKGSDAFSAVKSNIESSQAVRGVVAGPVSVSVATMTEDIARAFVPLTDIAKQQLEQLKQMNGKLGSAAGGGYAGRVPTT